MLQCAVVCGSVLQSEAVCEGLGLLYAVRCRVLQYVAVCCKCVASVLQCVAACEGFGPLMCSALQ